MASIEERALSDKNVKIVNWKDYKIKALYDENSELYFRDIDEMIDNYKNEGEFEKMPKYAYGCEFKPFQLDIDWILDNESEDHCEEILECVSGIKELTEAVEKFNKLNEKAGSYYEDIMTIVELD